MPTLLKKTQRSQRNLRYQRRRRPNRRQRRRTNRRNRNMMFHNDVQVPKSDAFKMVLCTRCGRATCHDGTYCYQCKENIRGVEVTSSEARSVIVPYSFKLLLQEMTAVWDCISSNAVACAWVLTGKPRCLSLVP